MPKTLTKIAVYARRDATVTLSGLPHRIRQNEGWLSTDPVVLEKPELFSAFPLVKTSPRGELVALD